eukprot:Unigene182_Nuclearia_a/m.609 Unigene182_Nuclearia_a/g.609  ORF Unigene182_Nuclearia_a/g.609 Unigene182_Nuclearia_a/m.609 type:complete len:221 (+) Unigene182_Nuclearia_a:172-834(+)
MFVNRHGVVIHEARIHRRPGASSWSTPTATTTAKPMRFAPVAQPAPALLSAAVERIRFAVKGALLRFAKPQQGNRVRARASLVLDLHRALFVALPQLWFSRRLGGSVAMRRFKLTLVGDDILDVLDPILVPVDRGRRRPAADALRAHGRPPVRPALLAIFDRVFHEPQQTDGAALVPRSCRLIHAGKGLGFSAALVDGATVVLDGCSGAARRRGDAQVHR